MKGVFLVLALVFIFFLIPNVNAEQTVKTVEIPLGFVKNAPPNMDLEKNTSFDPSDGIEEILNAEFILKGDFTSNTDISGFITNAHHSCLPSSIRTPATDVYNYEIVFDCSNYVSNYKGGSVLLMFNFTKSAKNVYARMRITYYNNPKAIMELMGTEYEVGDNGTVFLKLLDSNKNFISDGFCELTIYNPDENKTKWYDKTYMNYLENGIYYKDIFIPDQTGVYIIDAYCYYADVKYVFDIPYDVLYDGSLFADSSDDPENVRETDCVWIMTDGGRYQEFRYNDTEIGNVNLSTITSIDVITVAQHEKYTNYQIWNFSSNSWKTIYENDVISVTEECYGCHAHSINIPENFEDYVSGNEIRFRLYMDDSGKIYYDEVTFIFHNNGSVISDIRGSGELHVSNITKKLNSSIFGIPEKVWSYYNRTLTDYNQSGIFLYLEEINQTIYLQYENLTQLINNVNKSIHERINATNRSIWSKLFKIQDELFDINNNLTLVYNLIGDVNETIMNKLYSLQDEIVSLNETLLNISNITINITLEQEEILDTIIALLGDREIKQSYTSFAGFIPAIGLGGFGGFEEIQYYCKDNQTLVSRELINYTGDINKTYFRITERTCTYGCMGNSCILPPYTIYAIAFFIIVVIFLFYEYFKSKGYI